MKLREIPSNYLTTCFGCSTKNTVGLKLRFWKTEKGCTSRCTIPEHFCGFEGMVHGGIIATILDEIAAWTNTAHFNRIGITLEASIQYLKPVPTNTEILVESKIVDHDNKRSKISGTISNQVGTILAKGESKWLLPSKEKIIQIAGIDKSMIPIFEDYLKSIEELNNTGKK